MTLDQTLHALFTSTLPRRYTSPEGLALSYNPTSGLFRAGRIDHPPSATEIAAVRRAATHLNVSLSTTPVIRHMLAADGRTWYFAEWPAS